MPYLDHLTLPSGNTYELRDKRLDNLNSILHVSTSAADTPYGVIWTPEGGSEITGTLAADGTITIGDIVKHAYELMFLVYSPNDESGDTYDEWISVQTGVDSYVWEKIGSTDIHITGLKGEYTPAGTVSQPTFTGEPTTFVLDITPVGTVSQPEFSGEASTVEVTGTPGGEVTVSTVDVVTENYIVSGTTLAISTVNVNAVSGSTFSGSATTFTGAYTPAGTVSQPTFTGNASTGTLPYTPAGTVSQPTFTGTPATITVN